MQMSAAAPGRSDDRVRGPGRPDQPRRTKPPTGAVRAAFRLGNADHREREVLSHLVAGRTNAEIARDLFISDKNVRVHVTNVLRKTGTPNRIEAATLALRLGMS